MSPYDLADEWHCQLRTWKKYDTQDFCKAPNNRLIKAWKKVLDRRRAEGFVTEADGGKIGTPNQIFFLFLKCTNHNHYPLRYVDGAEVSAQDTIDPTDGHDIAPVQTPQIKGEEMSIIRCMKKQLVQYSDVMLRCC